MEEEAWSCFALEYLTTQNRLQTFFLNTSTANVTFRKTCNWVLCVCCLYLNATGFWIWSKILLKSEWAEICFFLCLRWPFCPLLVHHMTYNHRQKIKRTLWSSTKCESPTLFCAYLLFRPFSWFILLLKTSEGRLKINWGILPLAHCVLFLVSTHI